MPGTNVLHLYCIVVTWAWFWAYISGKSRVPMLQVLCNTSGEADSLNANTKVTSEFFIYACLNNSIMVKCG